MLDKILDKLDEPVKVTRGFIVSIFIGFAIVYVNLAIALMTRGQLWAL